MNKTARKMADAFGSPRLEEQAVAKSAVLTYRAIEDSHDGIVSVVANGEVISENDEGNTFELPVTNNVKAGDIVYATAYGETSAKQIVGHGAVGGGDRQQEEIDYSYEYIHTLKAENIEAADLVADHATIEDLDVDSMSAAVAYIGDLTAGNVSASDIVADHGTIGAIDSNYAQVDFANVTAAWIENGVIADGAISSAQINSLSANKLTAGTINGSNINVTNLNADNITTGTLNGQRIGTGSLSLDKLSEDVYTESEVNSIVDDLNARIDAQIETWTTDAVPTLNNYPASSWTTDKLKDEHVGDICYVLNAGSDYDGFTYRFAKSNSTPVTYSWVLIQDNQVTAALGRIDDLESFETTTSQWITETDTELTNARGSYTTLAGRIGADETAISTKVETSTFNTLSNTVDSNSSDIQTLTTITTNNGLTTSTNITSTVNSVSQTATENSSKISSLTTTLGTNADGTSKAGDIVHQVSDIDQSLEGITTRVGKTEIALKGNYATSSTAKGTTAKVATIVPSVTGFELYNGATVTVKFTNENTATTPTLNINSTGAKTIKTYSGAALSEVEYKWPAGATMTFTYDGTNWRIQDSTELTRIKSAETRITQTAESIESLATANSTYTAPDGTSKTNTLSSKITQTANSITSLVANNDTYTAPDGATQTNTIKSAIKQNADAIALRVEKNDVINQINVSTEGVTIDADRVNITGATIFTSGRLSESSLNSTYDANGAAATAKSEAINAAATDATTKANTAETNAKAYTDALETNAVHRTQRIYYRTSAAKSSWTMPSAWLTTTTDVRDQWTCKVPRLTANADGTGTKYLYLYTCEQREMADGIIAYTTVLLDDSTTIIDGGTLITGSVTANKLNASDINASKSLTVGAMTDAAAATILNSNISVGGRNLLGNTENRSGSAIVNDASACTFGSIRNYNDAISLYSLVDYDGYSNAVSCATSTSTGNRGAGWFTKAGEIRAGETYTFSCRIKCSIATDVHMHTAWRDGSATANYTGWTADGTKAISANTWTDYSYTFVPISNAQLEWEFFVAICITGSSSGATYQIAHAKLEKGNTATDWSPAPEDVTAYTDDTIDSIEVGGRNLVSSLAANWRRTTVSESSSVGTSWEYISRTASTTRISAIDLIPVNGDYVTVSLASGYDAFLTFFDTNGYMKKYLTWSNQRTVDLSEYSGVTAIGLTVRKSNNSTITLDEVATAKIKLERGNKATDWSPAPEDVDADISDAAKTATNYITADPTNGIRIFDSSASLANGTYQKLTNSAQEFYVDGYLASSVQAQAHEFYNAVTHALAARITSAGAQFAKDVTENGQIELRATESGQTGMLAELLAQFGGTYGAKDAKIVLRCSSSSDTYGEYIKLFVGNDAVGSFSKPNTDWQYLYGNANTAYWTRWRCYNSAVYVQAYYNNVAGAVTTSDVAIGPIDAGYRPDRTVAQQCGTSYFWVTSDGYVHVQGSTASRYLMCSLIYPVD